MWWEDLVFLFFLSISIYIFEKIKYSIRSKHVGGAGLPSRAFPFAWYDNTYDYRCTPYSVVYLQKTYKCTYVRFHCATKTTMSKAHHLVCLPMDILMDAPQVR